MSRQKLDQNQFIQQRRTLLEFPIPDDANSGVEDFLSNWEQLQMGITNGSVRIWPSMRVITITHPEFTPHQIWKRTSIILAVLTVILAIIKMKYGLVLLVITLTVYVVSRLVRNKDKKKFVEQIMKEANENLGESGMALICAHYLDRYLGPCSW